jgi:hypothetical protein
MTSFVRELLLAGNLNSSEILYLKKRTSELESDLRQALALCSKLAFTVLGKNIFNECYEVLPKEEEAQIDVA